MSTQMRLPYAAQRLRLVVVARDTKCIVCGRALHAGREAVMLDYGHTHVACFGEFPGPGGK